MVDRTSHSTDIEVQENRAITEAIGPEISEHTTTGGEERRIDTPAIGGTGEIVRDQTLYHPDRIAAMKPELGPVPAVDYSSPSAQSGILRSRVRITSHQLTSRTVPKPGTYLLLTLTQRRVFHTLH